MVKPKRNKNPGAKGGEFERSIAKDLSLWLSNGESDKHIWRTVGSGSWGTNRKTVEECGDLKAMTDLAKPLFAKINIECRTGKCMVVKDLFYGRVKRNNGINDFIEEGLRNEQVTGRDNIWILRELGHEPVVMMRVGAFNKWTSCTHKMQIIVGLDIFCFITYEEFKKVFKKENL